MGHPVPQCQGALERAAAKVQVTELRTDVLAAVALILDGERRGDRLVEYVDGLKLQLYVACRHLGILALALHDLSCGLDDEFTSEGSGCLHEGGLRVGFHHELGDAVTVPQVDEGHSAEFPGPLDPSGQGYGLSDVGDAEFSASVSSVHIFDVVVLSFLPVLTCSGVGTRAGGCNPAKAQI